MLAIEGSEKAFSLDDVAMNLDDLRGIAVESVPFRQFEPGFRPRRRFSDHRDRVHHSRVVTSMA
jgi:hypothetical protein